MITISSAHIGKTNYHQQSERPNHLDRSYQFPPVTDIDHRFDRDRHPFTQSNALTCFTIMRYIWTFMHCWPDPVTDEFTNVAITIFFLNVFLDHSPISPIGYRLLLGRSQDTSLFLSLPSSVQLLVLLCPLHNSSKNH